MNIPNRQRPSWAPRTLKLALSLAALVSALVVTVGVIGAATGIIPQYTPGKAANGGGGSPVIGQKGFSHCGDPGAPACPGTPDTWVHLASTAPADVIAAMQTCPDYMTPLQASGYQGTYSFPDPPVLVKPATSGGGEYYSLPHFIVRAAINGVREATYDLIYDTSGQRIRISSVGIGVPNDPTNGKPFPWARVTAQAAIAALQNARGLAMAPGATPELVFFTPPDPGPPGSMTPWLGGGEDPAHPIWRLKGADGRYHFVGTDGRVYEPDQLPIRQGTRVIQP